MRDTLTMSKEERDTLHFLRQLVDGALSVRDVAHALQRTPRHVYRLLAHYQRDGDLGVIHGLCGRPSNNSFDSRLHGWVTDIYERCYRDYGPVLFTEKLLEHYGITLDHETVRRWLIAKGLWEPAHSGHRHRKKRERRNEIGAMTQVDGSDHEWFEDRGPRSCLFVFIDDASSRTLPYFAPSEDTPHAFHALRLYLEQYGIMRSIYCDRGAVFGDKDRKTIFSRAARKLGIEMIYARSPQAKGRVERANRTHQDRLVKALREKNISDITAANRFMIDTYAEKHNALFAHTEGLVDIHRPILDLNLDNILCEENERQVYPDMTFRIAGQYHQILPGAGLLPVPRQRVIVRRWLDGSMHVFWKEHEIAFEPFVGRVLNKKPPPPGPPQDHPWRVKPPIGKAKRGGTAKPSR